MAHAHEKFEELFGANEGKWKESHLRLRVKERALYFLSIVETNEAEVHVQMNPSVAQRIQ